MTPSTQDNIRRHKFLTKEICRHLPPLYESENIAIADKVLQAKWFSISNNWTWYATEFDGEDTFFGWVDGECPEWGYFSLSELESAQWLGIPAVERDLAWVPLKFSELS